MTRDSNSTTHGQGGAPMPTGLNVLTGAGAILCAAHRDSAGQVHGHTWEIVAWWTGCPDALSKQAELVSFLSRFDHSVLPHELRSGEAIAELVLRGLECARVDVSRPLERIFATANTPQGKE